MRVIVRSPFDTMSDEGQVGVDTAVWLAKAGVDVLPMPTSLVPGLPRDFTRMLEKDPRGSADVMLAIGDDRAVVPARKRVWWVAYDGVPRHTEFDHVFVRSPVLHEQTDSAVSRSVLTVGLDPDRWSPVRRDTQRDRMVFAIEPGTYSHTRARIVRMWEEIVDSRPGWKHDLVEERVGADTSQASREALYRSVDVMLSLDRHTDTSGRGPEFMATGGTVIGLAGGGRDTWLHPDVSYVVGSLDEAKQAIVQASKFRADTARMGEKAAVWSMQSRAWPVVIEKMIKTLESL